MTTTPRRRRPVPPRLLCSQETANAVDVALAPQIGTLGRVIHKTEFVDALIAVALRHSDEVTEYLASADDETDDTEEPPQ